MKNFRRFDSIKKIKQVLFSFKVISEEEVKNAVKDLPIKKSISGNIPIKILNHYAFIYSKNLAGIFNESIKKIF